MPAASEDSLPPNQHLAAPGKWPVVGEKAPRQGDERLWTVTVAGRVEREVTLTLAEIDALPQAERVLDIHCVTRWSRRAVRFGGVLLATVLDLACPLPDARFVSFVARSDRNHSTSLPLADALQLGVLIARTHEGDPLETIHGGPVRTVTPERYFYKSVKWLERIELRTEDRLGYWEAEAGYHNRADPWTEERYLAPSVTRQQMDRLLRLRDISGDDLRGVDASGRDLHGLKAIGAKLRDARLENADLSGADFTAANLSNARLNGADLRNAVLFGADCEGADFAAADLRGADLTGASLFGATFRAAETDTDGATLDRTTRVDDAALSALAPIQETYVRRLTGR
jgi:DMSO/TMAO reductase YedYZ molybdopterin-dependent catalytic subunit